MNDLRQEEVQIFRFIAVITSNFNCSFHFLLGSIVIGHSINGVSGELSLHSIRMQNHLNFFLAEKKKRR